MEQVTGELQVNEELEAFSYASVEDIPGYKDYLPVHNELRDYLMRQLDRPSLCRQILETRIASKIARNEETGDLIGAYGWKCVKFLGKGKDGFTFYGHRYGDNDNPNINKLHIVKVLSAYAESYHNHTEIFNAFLRKYFNAGQQLHPLLLDATIKKTYTNYACKRPFTKFQPPDMKAIYNALKQVCSMNAWCIEKTGFVFWDLGYGNGRNFMLNHNKRFKWVDYGGAGMVRCPSFRALHKNTKGMPVLTLLNSIQEPLRGKENLVEGNSDFVMHQFLLNYEYHCNPKSTADIYASMLQVRKEIIGDMNKMLPNYYNSNFTRDIYAKFKVCDWLQHSTWKELENYIETNWERKNGT